MIENLHETYSVLRKRFKDNFVILGEGQGHSLPYHIKCQSLYWTLYNDDVPTKPSNKPYSMHDKWYDFHYRQAYYTDKAIPNNGNNWQARWFDFSSRIPTDPNSRVLDFGDTTAKLGFYIGTLATEYGLYSKQTIIDANQLEKLKDEIFYALKAVERLDKQAHKILGNSSSGYQGFFLRDDANLTLWRDAPDVGPNGTKISTFNVGAVDSDYVHGEKLNDFKDRINGLTTFISNDQVIYLYMGYNLCMKYLPANLISSKSTTPLTQMVKSQMEGFIYNIKSHGWRIKGPNGEFNPDSMNLAASGFHYPLIINSEKWLNKSFIKGLDRAYGSSLWHTVGNFLANAFSTFARLFLGPLSIRSSIVNKRMARVLIAMSDTVMSVDDLARREIKNRNQRDVHPLLHALIHDKTFNPINAKNLYLSLTDKLKDQNENPCRLGANSQPEPGSSYSKGWASDNRWLINEFSELDNTNGHKGATLLNGLDYLFAYNLLHLYYHPDTRYEPEASQSNLRINQKFSSKQSISGTTDNKTVKDHLFINELTNVTYFRSKTNNICEVKKNGSNWESRELKIGVSNVGDRVIYVPKLNKIYYRGTDNKIYNYYFDNGWQSYPLSNSVNNTTNDIVYDHNSDIIYYKGTDNRIYKFQYLNNQWQHSSLNQNVNNVKGSLTIVGNVLFYIGRNNKLYQFSSNNGSWRSHLTDSRFRDFKDSLFFSVSHNKLFYRSNSNKLKAMYWDNNRWNNFQVHNSAKNLTTKIYENSIGHIFFVSKNNKLNTVYWDNIWKCSSLGTENNNISMNVFIDSNDNVFYNGIDNHIYYYYYNGSRWKSICTNYFEKSKEYISVSNDRSYIVSKGLNDQLNIFE